MHELQERGSLCAYCWIIQVATALRVNSRARQWVSQWRSRSAKIWGANDPAPQNEQHEHDPNAEPLGRLDDIEAAEIVELLNSVLRVDPAEAHAEANLSRPKAVQKLWKHSEVELVVVLLGFLTRTCAELAARGFLCEILTECDTITLHGLMQTLLTLQH